MKALIISDKHEIIDALSDYFKQNNCDVIIYRWLLKALDNIEEIQPDMIFLSAAEYPRHWKTLASFVQSGIGGNEVKLFLYNPEPMEDEEKKKAEKLGITAYIESLADDQLAKIIPVNTPLTPSVETPKINVQKYELVFTHPESGKFIFGNAESSEGSDLFECELSGIESNLKINQYVRYVSVLAEDELQSFDAKIINLDTDENKLVLKVKNYYEEKI